MDLDRLVKQHRGELKAVARAVAEEEDFTLELPCALVDGGKVVNTTLNGVRSHLPCSVALASAPIEQFLTLKDRVGFNAAFEGMTGDDEVGETFVTAWDEAQKDLAEGAVCTLNDLVAFAEQAKKGWSETPRRMLVVAREGQTVTSGLVPVEWVLRG